MLLYIIFKRDCKLGYICELDISTHYLSLGMPYNMKNTLLYKQSLLIKKNIRTNPENYGELLVIQGSNQLPLKIKLGTEEIKLLKSNYRHMKSCQKMSEFFLKCSLSQSLFPYEKTLTTSN